MFAEMERNTTIANKKNGKSANKVNSEFAVNVPAKPQPPKELGNHLGFIRNWDFSP